MRRASTSVGHTNLKDFGSYGNIDSQRNLKASSDLEPSQEKGAKPKRGSILSAFAFNFDEEVESTKQDMAAKEQKMKAAPVGVVREHKISVAEQVVNDEEQWQKFRAQMREGGAKTGMQLKHNLDGYLKTRAQELEASGVAVPVSRNRRASLTDFASTLIRGDESRQNRRGSTFTMPNTRAAEAAAAASKRSQTRPARSGHDSYNECIGSLDSTSERDASLGRNRFG